MLSPPPPPAALPPPRRRYGRRYNYTIALGFMLVVGIIAGTMGYMMYQRSANELLRRQLAQPAPSGADASGATKDMPSGFVPAAVFEHGTVPKVERERLTDAEKKEEKQEQPPDDIGLEAARKVAWQRYWTNYEDIHKQRFEMRRNALKEMKTSVEASASPAGASGGAGNAQAATAPTLAPTPASAPGGAAPQSFTGLWGGGGFGGPPGLPGGGGFYPGLGPTPQIDRESQEQKIGFSNQKGDLGKDDIVPTVHHPPIPNALMAGSYIKMLSENEINSDVPGAALGRVTESVYATAGGIDACMLIPQGSKIIGRYNSVVGAGQSRLPGVMTRIIFPDGSSQAIGAMEAADNAGSAGWDDQVDRHLLLKFGSAAAAAAFGAAIQLSVPQNGINGYNSAQIIGASVGQQMGQLGQQIAQQNLSIPNTLTIRQGYAYTIILDKDVIMQPWSCDGTKAASILPIMSMQ